MILEPSQETALAGTHVEKRLCVRRDQRRRNVESVLVLRRREASSMPMRPTFVVDAVRQADDPSRGGPLRRAGSRNQRLGRMAQSGRLVHSAGTSLSTNVFSRLPGIPSQSLLRAR